MYKIPETYREELIVYRNQVDKLLLNEADPVQFKIFRVVRGIYEQRKKGTYMLRIRCAGGTITPSQLLLVSNLAESYGSTFLHITTRQEIQLHNLRLADTPDILDELYKMGLSTKGGGGNTVRNITASVESGISKDEVFDVTPYNIALTNFLIEKDSSFDLPRKLKIAFSCSEKDSALAVYNDLGFIAKVRDGKKGFRVFLGGSPSVKPMVGYELFEFLPANKIYGVALAVIDLFNRYGNRKNRHKARLRYVFYKYGKEKVLEYFYEIYNQFIDRQDKIAFEIKAQPSNTPSFSPPILTDEKFTIWKQRYTENQKQEGLFCVVIPIMHGNITAIQASALAKFAGYFGNDSIRFSRRQNINLRNIPEAYLSSLYNLLTCCEIEIDKPYLLGNMVSCTGADTCQLGICFAKGGLEAVHNKLAKGKYINTLANIDINISGCPNSCGQHLVADLGFAGRVSRNKRIYPSYNVFAGAVVNENEATLPVQIGEIAAKDLPEFTNDILELFHSKKTGKHSGILYLPKRKKFSKCSKNIRIYHHTNKTKNTI
jgi:sulfite reductase (ferredoxin)